MPSLKAITVYDKFEPAKHGTIELSDICSNYAGLTGVPGYPPDVVVILSTSGTAGKPKAALLTHNNMLYSEARVSSSEARRTEDDVMFDCSPLNHAVGFWHGLIAPMLVGGRSVLMQQFSPREAIELMNRKAARGPWLPAVLSTTSEVHRNSTTVRNETLNLWLCGGAPFRRVFIALRQTPWRRPV